MKSRLLFSAAAIIAGMMLSGCGAAGFGQKAEVWQVHDMNRPLPRVVRPGTLSAQYMPGVAPSDAIVLFDGKDASQWEEDDKDGGPIRWKVENGYMEVVKKTSGIRTKAKFGSCQLHVEWATPLEGLKNKGQKAGNSGVWFMGKYELQMLDSYENTTYSDGQAGAMYGQNPPLVNASLPPVKWQSFDVIFHRPTFKNGKVKRPATITVFHNGVLVQDNFEIWGETAHKRRAEYAVHDDREPLGLQNHSDPVRFRNIWIRPLKD